MSLTYKKNSANTQWSKIKEHNYNLMINIPRLTVTIWVYISLLVK